ncbi:hypothetical protein [Rhizobium sp. IMFF44]|uniref:hypothetical protein n=1 Tax=unclassified Rhizobium TaxID=2613769 RepID=UPI0035BAE3A0
MQDATVRIFGQYGSGPAVPNQRGKSGTVSRGCLDGADFRFRQDVLARKMPIPMPHLAWQMCRHETKRLGQCRILWQFQREYGFGDPQHLLFLKCAANESFSMVKELGIRQELQQHTSSLKKAARSGDSRLLE